MPDGLKKKIGPLPIWAWAIIAGGIIGGVILYGRRGQSSLDSTPVGSDTSGVIDPTTGLPYAGVSGGGLTGGGTTPTLADQVANVTGLIGSLRDAGLIPAAGSGGDVYYVTNTDTGEPTDAAVNNTSTAAPGGKPSALDRAMAAVQSGKVGPINTKRLKAAGYSQAQIDYHVKHKTPLQQPQKTKTKPTPKHTSAPTHPHQHVTVAPPNHGHSPSGTQKSAAQKAWEANKSHTVTWAQHQKNLAKK